jgi:hypothetical protein
MQAQVGVELLQQELELSEQRQQGARLARQAVQPTPIPAPKGAKY